MTTRKSMYVSVAVVAVAVLWYLFRPDALVVSKTVDEPLPGAEHAMSVMEDSSSTVPQSAMVTREPVRLTSGRFHKNAHATTGLATIYRLEDGRRVLRFTGFATSNGPDVRVYLVAAGDVQDEAAVKKAAFVDLGALKGNIGDQNYDVPTGLDLSRYRAVSIWCRRFSVNFVAAPLAEIPA